MPAAQRFLGRKCHDRRTGSRGTNDRSDYDAAFRDFVPKDFLSLPASRSITAHTLIKLFLTSMKLMPVALAAQCFGMAAIDAVMRTKPEMFELLLVWSFWLCSAHCFARFCSEPVA